MATKSLENRTVKLHFPRHTQNAVSKSDGDTFLSMVEHILSCHYKNYELILERDRWNQQISIEIIFESADDAAWFKLTHMNF